MIVRELQSAMVRDSPVRHIRWHRSVCGGPDMKGGCINNFGN